MTDNEIINALNGNISNAKKIDCKVWSIEVYKLENALDLINRQKAEIESLKHRKTELQIRNQELQHEKSEAIKEFAERLKMYSFVDNLSLNGKETVYVADIDNIVKEMTEVQE